MSQKERKQSRRGRPTEPAAANRTLSRDDTSAHSTQFGQKTSPRALLAAAVLALSIAAVYGPALNSPFFFDDVGTIETNQSIRSLWPLVGTVEHPGPLLPAPDLATSGRPLVNLTFALNYAMGELRPWGYHFVNAVIHFCSAVLLWAIVRRTLLLPYFNGPFESSAGWLALAVALLWALHPLQTEAVVYATQRTELMVALFYLATLYCSLRYWTAFLPLPLGERRDEGSSNTNRPSNHQPPAPRLQSPRPWLFLSILACACGMASKEVMVSAPLMILLFERTFIAGSLLGALRRSWPLYVGLACTLLLLLALVVNSPRSESAGFHLGTPLTAWWMTQAKVLLIDLKLVIWPWPLSVHYQLPYLRTFADAWMYVIPVLALGLTTLALLWRNRPAGYLGTWVFAILAPTTVVPILTEMAAERRMYLPLAAILVLFVVGGYLALQALLKRSARTRQVVFDPSRARNWAAAVAVGLIAVCGVASANRLYAYSDPALLWQEVAAHQPSNFVAHGSLGELFLKDPGQQQAAIDEFKAALALNPDYLAARCNLGRAYIQSNQLQAAIETLEEAVKSHPDYPEALNSLGVAYTKAGRLPEAVDALGIALKLNPNFAAAHANLGAALLESNRAPEAIEHFQQSLTRSPHDPDTRVNLGRALMSVGRTPDAIAEFKAAVAESPRDPVVLNNLGFALTQLERFPQAVTCLRLAVQLKPDYALAHNNLGNALYRAGDLPRAIDQFRRVLELNPNDIIAHNNLGQLQANAGNLDEATKHYQEVVRIQPTFVQGYFNLAQALKLMNRKDDAIAAARKGIEGARASDQTAVAEQIETWLTNELKVPQGTPGALPAESAPKVQ